MWVLTFTWMWPAWQGLAPAFVIQALMSLNLRVFSIVILWSALSCLAMLTYSPVPFHKEILFPRVVVQFIEHSGHSLCFYSRYLWATYILPQDRVHKSAEAQILSRLRGLPHSSNSFMFLQVPWRKAYVCFLPRGLNFTFVWFQFCPISRRKKEATVSPSFRWSSRVTFFFPLWPVLLNLARWQKGWAVSMTALSGLGKWFLCRPVRNGLCAIQSRVGRV